MADEKRQALSQLPAITDLLNSSEVQDWLKSHPHHMVSGVLREAVAYWRRKILDSPSLEPPVPFLEAAVLETARGLISENPLPRVRSAINATGIILHTGLGRAVFSAAIVDSMLQELKGYCTLAVGRESGDRVERDELVEPLLCELSGAPAATVVNNNAAATLLVLSALAAGKEVIVSRGQLIEIGGSFRLPEVMAQSGAKLVEVGATNRTHLKDYERAITERTAAIMRVHPSNYRIVGFTCQPSLKELADLARRHQLTLIDDLGAGALVDLQAYGLPHEPTVQESIRAGADIVLFSADKLIGASQGGIILGRRDLVTTIRKHPLMRAIRVDKTCVMVLERTLELFRFPERLTKNHPTYRMLSAPLDVLQARAENLLAGIKASLPMAEAGAMKTASYLGSGSLPTEAIPSAGVTVSIPPMSAAELSRSLRTDEACIFGRIENESVCLDMRTLTDDDIPRIVEALGRIAPG
jgi:L-seryl-tRNA(Ser) seleniumtransferase